VAALSGAEVVAGTADAPVVRGERPQPEAVLTAAEVPLLAQVSAGLPPAPPCRVDVEAGDGDRLPGGIEVLAVPGHTPGSIALHLPAVRAALTGDTVAESGGALILGPFNVDRAAAWASLRRLAGLDPDVVAVGHGDPVAGGAAALLRAATDPLG
jgi:glyoxylase-like metal-dependent hydrolase (beta-lactamase superfamily II)